MTKNQEYKSETSDIPKGIREIIYDRDGECCRYKNCNERGHLDIHHRIPKSLGASHDYCNLVHLCRKHHDIMQKKVPKKLNHLVAVPFEIHMYDFNGTFCQTHKQSLGIGRYEKEI